MDLVVGEVSETYEARSADEASQLVREGWVLTSIKKHRDQSGKSYLVYYMKCPCWYEPKPRTDAPLSRSRDDTADIEVNGTATRGPLSLLVRWVSGQLGRAASVE